MKRMATLEDHPPTWALVNALKETLLVMEAKVAELQAAGDPEYLRCKIAELEDVIRERDADLAEQAKEIERLRAALLEAFAWAADDQWGNVMRTLKKAIGETK